MRSRAGEREDGCADHVGRLLAARNTPEPSFNPARWAVAAEDSRLGSRHAREILGRLPDVADAPLGHSAAPHATRSALLTTQRASPLSLRLSVVATSRSLSNFGTKK